MENGREDDEDGELEPCSEAAREQGCICTWSRVWSNSVDPPRQVISRDCPVHGIDPDTEYERRRDDKEDR